VTEENDNNDEDDQSLKEIEKAPEKNKGSYLLALERSKEDRKIKLWHSRLAFTKKGHSLMQEKLFSEAAVVYEKYLKILEMIFECKKGQQLGPDHFKESARTAELSVVTSVYWDLLRIYDTSDAYGERQKKVALQLAKFAPLTPVFSDLLKKAIIFQKKCRHPEIVKLFINSATTTRPRCFIATSAFESPLAIEVQILRRFRDQHLRKYFLGRKFIYAYYKVSPRFACALDKHAYLKKPIRYVLQFLIKCVS
jgi:hypothetical protein